jgi:membrane protein DedA with SNARE-associated domain
LILPDTTRHAEASMTAADFVQDYGYYAVVVGTFFEGELVMLAAGVAASTGLLSLPAVILAGMAGIFASDTFCFLLGRLLGERLKRWFPRLHGRLDGVFRLIERYQDRLIVYFQFFPGLCTVTPVAFGMTRISLARFMALDFVGNAFWTLVFSLGGYAFGAAFEKLVQGAHHWELGVYGVFVVVALLAWWLKRLVGRKLSRAAG